MEVLQLFPYFGTLGFPLTPSFLWLQRFFKFFKKSQKDPDCLEKETTRQHSSE